MFSTQKQQVRRLPSVARFPLSATRCLLPVFRPLSSVLCLLLFCPLSSVLCPLPLFGADLDSRVVNANIDRAVDYLKSKQNADGSWDEYMGTNAGVSSLCTLALLNAGLDKNDPTIDKSLAYLRKFSPGTIGVNYKVYSVALQTMVFSLADPSRDKTLIRRNVNWLDEYQQKGGRNAGGWGYGDTSQTDYADLSNSQYAVLALYEAERVGVRCDPVTWELTRTYWERAQNRDGSWGYRIQDSGTGSMTCAGIASFLIANGMVEKSGAFVEGNNIFCCQGIDETGESRIRQGLNWLGRHFSVSSNPKGPGQYLFYYLYGLERTGRMTGQRFIGEHDWYREGTEYLIKRKGELLAFWGGPGRSGEYDLIATSFALLFLSKGRRPILLSKIQYGTDDSWNAHSQDVEHLTRFVEKQWKTELNWQTTDWEKATLEDLLQSPVLYICGNKNPLPRDKVAADRIVAKLREYLDQGGFLFAEAYGEDSGFDAGFRAMMQKVLPEEGYEFRLLEEDHPVWSAEIPVPTDQIRPIEGIDFGCRTSVIYCPPVSKNARFAQTADSDDAEPIRFVAAPRRAPSVSDYRPSLSCLWEIAQMLERGNPYAKSIQKQIDAGLAIGCNVLAYATNREVLSKLERKEAVAIATIERQIDRGTVAVGLLEHGGGSNCAPRAIPRLMEAAVTKFGLPVDTKVEKVRLTDPKLAEYPILFMHGRTAFRFSAEERTALKNYIQRGGFLCANSICASVSFTKSFEEEMGKIFPEAELLPIPTDDPLYSNRYNGYEITTVELRMPQRDTAQRMKAAVRETAPELSGIRFENRLSVIFSPYDISCALEKLNSIGCKGYTQQSALELGINILLYALEHL